MALKQVILIRQDLKLPKGKACAQSAHASLTAALRANDLTKWQHEGQAKIVLKVKDEKELIEYFQAAKDKGLPVSLITDAGRTVIAPGTKTAAAIGPAQEEEIDAVTGELPLL